MKSLNSILKEKRSMNLKIGLNSERSYVISQFVEEINKERIGTVFKPLSAKVIAIKLSHLKLQDLYTFLSLCKDYKNRQESFSKYFWGALKIK